MKRIKDTESDVESSQGLTLSSMTCAPPTSGVAWGGEDDRWHGISPLPSHYCCLRRYLYTISFTFSVVKILGLTPLRVYGRMPHTKARVHQLGVIVTRRER
jgi:hypothetical protein